MNNAKMVMTSPEGLRFEWSGGEYIEVRPDIPDDPRTLDVINVWDYAEGKPEIVTLFDFAARVRRYVNDEVANYGTCDTCGSKYDTASRMNRCGDCGDCEYCCNHKVCFCGTTHDDGAHEEVN
jgi:hypothetical protein